jgi:hypothetical protein
MYKQSHETRMIKRLAATAAILLIFFTSPAILSGQAATHGRVLFQETSYPMDGETPIAQPTGYEGPETPTDIFLGSPTAYPGISDTLEPVRPTQTPIVQSTRSSAITATASPTSGPTPTAGRNLFSTEDAEIQNSRVTPRATDTAAPTRTPHLTSTTLPGPSPTPVPPFLFDSSWFLAGVFIPAGVLFIIWLIYRLKNSGEFKN